MLREMFHETPSCVILVGMGRPPKDIRTRRDIRSGRYLICYIEAPDDFVFTLSGAAPVSGMGVISAFRRGLKAAGYAGEPWTPYWLRHSFGTYHLADLDDSELLMLMGHTNIVTNATYRHPDDDIVRKRALPRLQKTT